MQLQYLAAEKFRNLKDLELHPVPGMNVICGENAQGKTSLLEAIYLLSTVRSFRTRQLPEALQFGATEAILHGHVQTGQSKHTLSLSLTDRGKTVLLDRKKVDAVHYLGIFHVMLFSYPLLEVIRGGPEERRKFFDRSIAISKPAYLNELIQYHRAVRQKNALLQSFQRGAIGKKEGMEEIRSFNQQLLMHGIEISKYRTSYLEKLRDLLIEKKDLFFEGADQLNLLLRSSFLASKEEIEQNLEKAMEREIVRGFSLIGVHRDEIEMTVNGKELRKYGSSGQHRAFLLLMLLAQLELYEAWREERPVLLLDDLDSELDQNRIQAFLGVVRDRYQTVISTSRRDLFSEGGNLHVFEIKAGSLLEHAET